LVRFLCAQRNEQELEENEPPCFVQPQYRNCFIIIKNDILFNYISKTQFWQYRNPLPRKKSPKTKKAFAKYKLSGIMNTTVVR